VAVDGAVVVVHDSAAEGLQVRGSAGAACAVEAVPALIDKETAMELGWEIRR
jgi:hypothetical protein